RLLDREVTRLRALEDLIDVAGGTPELIGQARSVGHEHSSLRERSPDGDAWQPVLREQLGDLLSIPTERRGARDDQPAHALLDRSRDAAVEICRLMNFEWQDVDAERSGGFDRSLFKPKGANSRVPEKARVGETRNHGLQELQLLSSQLLGS